MLNARILASLFGEFQAAYPARALLGWFGDTQKIDHPSYDRALDELKQCSNTSEMLPPRQTEHFLGLLTLKVELLELFRKYCPL